VWSALAGMVATAFAFGISLSFNAYWTTLSYAAMLLGTMPSGFYYLKKTSQISNWVQLKACATPGLFALLMALTLILIRHLLPESLSVIARVGLQITCGTVFFIGLALIFDRQGIRDIKRYLVK
jgi:hypothetical protein